MSNEINTGSVKQMKDLIARSAIGETVVGTAEGEIAVLVKDADGSARLHMSQEEKPMWDIVIYYDSEGKKEGEGVKPTIINDLPDPNEPEAPLLSDVFEALEVVANYYDTTATQVRHLIENSLDKLK